MAKTINGGRLIIFDGLDGAGKTTQLNLVKQTLVADGWQVYATRNLGGTPIGESLRAALLKPDERPVETDFYVGVAIQAALIPIVSQEKAKGSVILMDRGPMSLVAYQVYGSGLNEELGWRYADYGMNSLKPDLTIIYETNVDTALKRARQHSTNADYFESKPLSFFNEVSQGFKAAAERYGCQPIDANLSIEAVQAATIELIRPLLEPNHLTHHSS